MLNSLECQNCYERNQSTESTNWQFDESWVQVDLGKMGNQFIYKFQSNKHHMIAFV